jgi:hypothetical protein
MDTNSYHTYPVTSYFDGSPRPVRAAGVSDASDMAGFWSNKAAERADSERAARNRGKSFPFAAAMVRPKATAPVQLEAGPAPKAVHPPTAAANRPRSGPFRAGNRSGGFNALARNPFAPNPSRPVPISAIRPASAPASAAAMLSKGQPAAQRKAAPVAAAPVTAAELLAAKSPSPKAAAVI